MNPHRTLSSYLVRPDLTPRRQRNWAGFRTQLMHIRRANPRIASRTLGALFIWTMVAASINYIASPPRPGRTPFSANHASLAQQASVQPGASLTTLATVAHAQELPSGPSGQLLPPGTMASDRTYPNNYAWGQCTWYVAGRRQVPSGWGNAANWYYHAIGSGWSAGAAPAVAAIAWTPAGWYGHVALVENVSTDGRQIYISEMNYQGVGVKSYRWAPSTSFKYIY